MTKHAHHFVFPKPDGETSVGVCKTCGESRELPNRESYSEWDHKKRTKKVKITREMREAVYRAPVNDL